MPARTALVEGFWEKLFSIFGRVNKLRCQLYYHPQTKVNFVTYRNCTNNNDSDGDSNGNSDGDNEDEGAMKTHI